MKLDIPARLTMRAALAVIVSLLATAEVGAQSSAEIEAAVSGLEWREIGPTIMGGRVADLAVVESDPATYYVGTATGGVWKTTNGGVSFESVFDDPTTSSIGDVTLAPSNPNVVWVGTGEPQNRQSSPWGNGVYRSTDAGRTWAHLGLENTHHISRIRVHPRDPDVAYVAAVGHLWGANPERGVYKTTDGGETWELVLFVDENTGAIDLAMDPNDPETLFAAMYQRRRTAWGFNGGGPGSGIYRTTDGGSHWEELTEGLPDGDKGRIGLDIYRGDGNLVYAIVEADARRAGQGFGGGGGGGKNGVYKSTDRGETWEQVSTVNNRPMYYSQIRIDPTDPERLYTGGSSLYRSSDGGRTFTPDAAEGVHLDHHALWIDPSNSDHMILGSDGGVSYTRDRGENWYQHRNLPLAQFYEIGVDNRDPYHVCGGLQDNGSWCAPSDTWSNQGIRTRDWYNVGSGDGFYTVMHPDRPHVMFAESQGGNVTRVNLETMERVRMRPVGRPGGDGEDPDLRWNWNTPIVLSRHDPNTVYTGANIVFKSTDLGATWEAISPDLTWAIDRDELEIMGVPGTEPMMSLHDGTSSYGNLITIAESPVDGAVLYAGSDDGRVHVTRDGGETWTDVTAGIPGLPEQTYVSRLVASHADVGTVYASFDGHRNDDFSTYVYRSDDFGASWRSITTGLPENSVNVIAQHPRSANLLFLGNEIGVYFSVNEGVSWNALSNNMPAVPVDDIQIQERGERPRAGHARAWHLDPLGHLAARATECRRPGVRGVSVPGATGHDLHPLHPAGMDSGGVGCRQSSGRRADPLLRRRERERHRGRCGSGWPERPDAPSVAGVRGRRGHHLDPRDLRGRDPDAGGVGRSRHSTGDLGPPHRAPVRSPRGLRRWRRLRRWSAPGTAGAPGHLPGPVGGGRSDGRRFRRGSPRPPRRDLPGRLDGTPGAADERLRARGSAVRGGAGGAARDASVERSAVAPVRSRGRTGVADRDGGRAPDGGP